MYAKSKKMFSGGYFDLCQLTTFPLSNFGRLFYGDSEVPNNDIKPRKRFEVRPLFSYIYLPNTQAFNQPALVQRIVFAGYTDTWILSNTIR